jgi:hypothetical protein
LALAPLLIVELIKGIRRLLVEPGKKQLGLHIFAAGKITLAFI